MPTKKRSGKTVRSASRRVKTAATSTLEQQVSLGPVKLRLSPAAAEEHATRGVATDPLEALEVKRGPKWEPLRSLFSQVEVTVPELKKSLEETTEDLPQVVRSRLVRSMVASALPTVTNVVFDKLRSRTSDINPAMDPRLQVALARHRMGMPRIAFASVGASQIAVLARVNDLQQWEAISEVRAGATIGRAADDHTYIVTARIPINRIEYVRQQQCVVSLKASQPLRPNLASTTQEIGVRPAQLPPNTASDGGKGVVLGVVDFGCDFAHKNFRLANGKSRILAIWDQSGIARPTSPQGYGRLYVKDEIDAALKTIDPYRRLGYSPREDFGAQIGTHGTHVMDIATGNGLGSGVPGCAPEADIVFVESSTSKLPWFGPEAVGQSLGDSVQMIEAVRYIFEFAGTRPCVVNLSMGTNGGPHDGTTLVDQSFDALVRSAPNRAIVIAASNSYADGIHAEVAIPPSGTTELIWRTPPSVDGHEIEIWLPANARVAIELIAPDGTSLGIVEADRNLEIKAEDQLVAYIANRIDDPNNRENFIGVFIAGGVPEGSWKVRLHSQVSDALTGHAWIERYDSAQSSFANPSPRYTLGSISCGRDTIVVGSYDAHKPTLPISYFSSAGPTKDGRQKPEVSAPGHDVVAARSRSGNGVTTKSGTSMAAPAVSGLIALVLAEALRKNTPLTVTDIRQRIITTARLNPPGGPAGTWDERFGAGRISSGAVA
jgi:subtilisin family serine protease